MNELCGSSSSSTSNVAYRIELKPHNNTRSMKKKKKNRKTKNIYLSTRRKTKTYVVRWQKNAQRNKRWKRRSCGNQKDNGQQRAVSYSIVIVCVCRVSIRNRFEQVRFYIRSDAYSLCYTQWTNGTSGEKCASARKRNNKQNTKEFNDHKTQRVAHTMRVPCTHTVPTRRTQGRTHRLSHSNSVMSIRI